MQIREFVWPDDFDAVTGLWLASGLHNPTIDGIHNLRDVCQRNPGLFLLAIDNDQVVGSVIGTFDGRRGYIYHVAVHPNSRRKGYATALLREVERRLWAMGVQKVRFMVSKTNDQAIAFYRTLGFEVDEHSYSMSKTRTAE
jgi:ribosomal protein S18 acetylase RimI-like enzyme